MKITVKVETGTAELIPDPEVDNCWTLRLNGVAQSHVDLEDPLMIAFDYIRRIADVIEEVAQPGPLDFLHLGGGALTLPRCLDVLRWGSRQRVVELDPLLLHLVQEHLPLPEGAGIEVVLGDARDVLAQTEPGSVDVIVADIFNGSVVPEHVTTVEFGRLAARALRPKGVYVANLMDTKPLSLARGFAATLREAFPEVAMIIDGPAQRGRSLGNVLLVAAADVDLSPLAVLTEDEESPRVRVLWGAKLSKLVAEMPPWYDSAP